MKKGFTLIELLVVIAIIGILATVVVVNLGGARKKARRASIVSSANEVITGWNVYSDDKAATGTGTYSDFQTNIANYVTGSIGTFTATAGTPEGPISFTILDSSGKCSITVINSVIPSASTAPVATASASGFGGATTTSATGSTCL